MPSTNLEQFMLELINDARLDPIGNASRYISSYSPLTGKQSNIQNAFNSFGVNGSALASAFSALSPVQPLAFNDQLATAARNHTQLMINNNSQSHQLPGEPALGTRITNAGYTGWTSLGENIFAKMDDVLYGHAAFMVDWGAGPNGMQSPPGHRDNIMSSTFREAGIGILSGTGSNVGPLAVTQDLGTRGTTGVFVLGVAYNDTVVPDRFYTAGEGLAGLTVGIAGGGSTSSSSSGGYSLQTTLTGSRTITLSGAGLPGTVSFTTTLSNGQNIKFDVVNGNELRTSVSGTIAGPVSIIQGLGVTGLSLTTNDAVSRTFNGTNGGDALAALGTGNDLFRAGLGTNTVNGGPGTDSATYSFNSTQATITQSGGSWIVSGPGQTDTLTNVEFALFPDRTVTLGGGAVAARRGDFNRDGTSDLVLQGGTYVVEWFANGGRYSGGNAVASNLPAGWLIVGGGDLNGDGNNDLLLQGGSNVVAWFLNGSGSLASAAVLTNTLPSGWNVVGTGDFNRDGTRDVLLRGGGNVVNWIMQGGNVIGANVLSNALPSTWQVVGTGDLNRDGSSDIVLQGGSTVVEWLVGPTGGYQSGATLTSSLPFGWLVRGTGDFNGDATDDLLVHGGGTVVDWIMQNGAVVGGNVLTTTLPSGWTPVATGDYNGDATTDIALHGGTNVVDWIMRNGQVVGGNVLSNALPGGWRVAPI